MNDQRITARDTQRVIKFRVVYKGKINGYERLTPDGWEWMALDINPEGRENWYRGVFPYGYDYKRNQFTGLTDKHGKEIYEGDVLSFDYDPEMAICGENHDRKPIESDYDRAVYVVQYEDGYRLCGKGIHQKLYLHAFRFQYTKRLGDIYTTPELVDPKMIEHGNS